MSLHCPLTPDTLHWVNAQSIAQMKKGIILINTGRGALVDTVALINGLESGHIGAAGLDVYEHETGLFFESENQKDLTEKIKLMYQDEKLRSRISENQKKMILKYSWGNIANQYMNLFEKL